VSEPSAAEGGAGAPPPPDKANQAREGLTRTYDGQGIRIHWYAARCIHSAACVRANPSVFDPTRRPWIEPGAAEADTLARVVELCPTGALKYERTDGGPEEQPAGSVSIVPIANGPYFVRGPIDLVDPKTGESRRETRIALCRCGRSKHLPFCDNTHRATGFRTDGNG
jgi:uncharacterized Fe-S cluster protein YjdI/CDGSH-type Zn-finger protein